MSAILHSIITYNRTDLLRIGNFTGTALCPTADVCVTPLFVLNNRRTRRGCRAGRSKQRPIGRVSLARENEAAGSWGQEVHILHVNV